MDKKEARLKRASRFRFKVKKLNQNVVRLIVYKTPKHIYAQMVDAAGKVLTSASTIDKEIKKTVTFGGNIEAAKVVGKFIAERAKKIGISDKIIFDRAGFRYHGRVKALADAAREDGINF